MSERLLRATARFFGSPKNFTGWLILVSVWGCAGPLFHFSNTWQLMVNTPTTLVELFAAIAIQHVANEVERKQDATQALEMRLTEHIEDITERIEKKSEAQLAWMAHLHRTLWGLRNELVHEAAGTAASSADPPQAANRA